MRERKTRFVEIFRTTPTDTVCPNFYVLMHANGCSFSPLCSYCYLKSSFWFLDRPHVFTNADRMVREIRRWIRTDNLESFVLNTGNLSDSLSFEEARPLMRRLVDLFAKEAEARSRRHSLLMVTKGGMKECTPLFAARPCRNVIVAFSMNVPEAAQKHERGAAPTESRLEAARRLKREGWRVRIRMDPMIKGYNYAPLIREVRRLAPERVTLGTLRAEPNLPRRAGNGLFSELVRPAGRTGLARYPLAVRLGLYRPAVRALRTVCPMGLCEETPDVWRALRLDTEARRCNCGL